MHIKKSTGNSGSDSKHWVTSVGGRLFLLCTHSHSSTAAGTGTGTGTDVVGNDMREIWLRDVQAAILVTFEDTPRDSEVVARELGTEPVIRDAAAAHGEAYDLVARRPDTSALVVAHRDAAQRERAGVHRHAVAPVGAAVHSGVGACVEDCATGDDQLWVRVRVRPYVVQVT